METIMSLVIEESEDISSELLSSLLDTLKKDNKDVLPIAENLAEEVMGTCASKLKPHMVELIQSTGASLSEYNNVVASICQESSCALDHAETHVSREALADDSKLSERTVSDELPQVSAKLEQEVGCPENVGTAAETSPVAATSNGDVQMGNGDTMEQPSSPKQKSERSRRSGQSKNVASDENDIVNVESIAVKPDGTADLRKVKGRTTNSSAQLTDYIDRIDSDKDAPVATSRRKVPSKEPEDTDVEAPTGLTSDSEVKPRRNAGKRGRFKRKVVERESSGRKVPSKEGEAASAHEAESTSAQEGETAVSSEPEKNNELQHLLGPDGPTSDSQPSPISSPPNPSRAKKGRSPGPKGAADRSDVYAASGTLASASVQNDPAENSQAHNKVMPSKDDDSKEPEDADDVEAPTGLTSDSEVKPRRNTGKRGRFKRKVVERECSGRKVPSKEGKAASAHEAQEGKTAVPSEPEKNNKLQHLLGSDGPTSDSQPSPISSPPNRSWAKRGRPPGPKEAAERSDVYAAAGTLASASVQNDHAENSQAHNKVMPSMDDDDSKEPEDDDDVEAPTGLTSDSEVKQRRNTGKRGQFKRKVVEREFSGRKQSSNTKQQKEEETHDKDVDGEPSLKEMASSPGSASKALSVDCTRLDNNVKTKRRKLALETEEISETLDHKKQLDEHLVGSKIEVWWPDDKMFYKGIVDSYDPVTKNHKIVYTDGDVEVLLLKNELWEFAESDSENAGGKRKAEGSASQTPHNKKAKGSSNTPSKQAKSQAQSKSGTETSSRDVPRPRGRPRSGTSDVGKLSYDDAPGTSQKSEGKSVSSDKEKTPRSSGKKLEGPENEPEDGNPRTSSKREESGNKSKNLASKPGSAAKGDTTKNAGKLKGEPSKSGRKSRNETLKASTNLKNDTLKCSSKSADDTGKSKDSTPRTASRAETDEDGKKKTLRTKPKTNSTPKTGGDSKANDISSKGKMKVGESESAAPVSDGEATTGGRKRKRRGPK